MPRPARPWFRLYSDILDNLKVKSLKPALRWQWIELLALANLTTPRGHLPPVPQMAFRLRVSEAVALDTVNRLMVAGLVDATPKGYVMHDWEGADGWQYDSDAMTDPGVAGSIGNHKRWHEARGVVQEGCPFCIAPTSPRHRPDASPGHPKGYRPDSQRESRDPEADTDTETDQRQSDRDPIDQLVADFASYGDTGSGTVKAIEWAVKDHGLQAVQRAVRKAAATATGERVRFSYVETILEGKGDNANNRSNTAAQLPAIPDDPDAPGYKNPGRVQPARAVGGTPGAAPAPDSAGLGDDR